MRKADAAFACRNLLKNEKGQSLTEFALLVPLLLLIVCGMLDVGRVVFTYLQMNLVAQEAVRLGGLGKGDADITAFSRANAQVDNRNALQVTISPAQSTRKSGDYVKVTLQYSLPYITPLIGSVLPKPLISADSTIRVE
ncbi:TadE/TadG family type IV pilus assembly protein [Paenibacillus hexagrammi]|uniref:Pilus assembly protein n=1 Tax=Paenibacillus hexagrammi TaxID=2908839 RepID=A0ABY3SFN8_9BACL|nr:TadE/TadG family type IV pilus assembly protein [Paenibacillus sp. YPD9-1]UJF32838.1 pilus assembly protein [Paenibacillus sp. YPD9-1]